MYSRLPSIVIGFHGCDASVRDGVLTGELDLQPSRNSHDWLGAGVYFWEQNYARAEEWAQQQVRWG